MSTMHEHIVKSYDEEQRRLLDEILRMGGMAAAQLEAALDVVERRDDKAAERIVANDEAIDAIEQSIDHDVMRLALRGPLARDLRTIFAARSDSLRIVSSPRRVCASRSRWQSRSAHVRIVASGLFSSWATPEIVWPSAASFSAWSSC